MNSEKPFDKFALLREIMKHQDESRVREIADLMRVAAFPAGHTLCREGETGDVLFVIGEGRVEVTQKNEEGHGIRRLGEAGRGDLIGEMSLLQNAPRNATVTTLTDCTVLEMDKKDLETILGHNPAVAVELVDIANERQRINDVIAMETLFDLKS
jgi:ATP-binding cassette, subfamily B, bacterial